MPQQYKIDKVESLKKYFDENESYIFTDYRGLDVAKITELRNELRKLDAKYVVVKNNFVKVIAKEREYPELGDNLVGPTAIAFSNSDVNEVAKALVKFEKDSALDVKGGYFDGQVFNAEEVEAFSKLPGKKELIAMFMATLQAPLQNLAYALNDVPGSLVRVVNAVKEQKEKA